MIDLTCYPQTVTAARQASTLVPEGDERQALRLRRYLMAAGTSMMVIVLLYVAYLLGGLERAGSSRAPR